ncbi:hypothetical protein BsWGS_25413 [Bradybaena similaris]
MCTQKRYVEDKDHGSSRRKNRHEFCVARRFSFSSCGGVSTGDTTKPGGPRFLKSTSWYVQMLFYNSSSSSVDGRCLLAEQSIKCRHLICLIFACLAVSASAQSTANGYDVSSSPRSEATQAESWPVIYDTNTNIPLLADSRVSSDVENLVTSTVTPALTQDRTSLADIGRVENTTKDDRKNAESQSELMDTSYVDKKSVYFILNTFHRYSENDFLLKTDLEKLLANIGFTSALNSSESGVTHNDGTHGDHSHEHGHHHHHEQKRGHQDKRTDNIQNNSSDFTFNNEAVSATIASLQERVPDGQRAQSADQATPATSRLGRHRRTVSQHEEHNKCLSTKELLQFFQYEHMDRLNADHFWHLCPALIDQLDAGVCKTEPAAAESNDLNTAGTSDHEHTHDGSEHDHHDHTDYHEHDHGNINNTDTQEQGDTQPVTATVWFYALLSVAVISLCSVAGVVVIPNMKRVFYNHILQFLVALAVGAMSGDAMLHLFPHAMLSDSHDHHHHEHDENKTEDPHSHHQHPGQMSSHLVGLYKGLVALMGIYSFFFLERLFTLFTRNRSGRSERKQKRRRHCSGDGHEQKSKAFHMVNSKLETDGGNAPSCEEMVMIVHPNKALRAYADVSHEAYLHRCDESLVHSPPGQTVVGVTSSQDHQALKEDSSILEGFTNLGVAGWSGDQLPATISDAEIIGIIKDTEPVPSIHSHSHSHLAPDFVGPVSSVAMMIIVGDMIHNFCDGLAIGAAYAGSIAGGLSTSVAVFCHELPHEIGDFAVLVRSGLTLKKAVYFNLVSSIPCFVGCIIGLAVGNLSSTSSWIFAGVGGMFLYVTLVDLIPEMSSVYTKSGEPWFLHLLLQGSGIAVGTTIMLIISVSEESLLTAFH